MTIQCVTWLALIAACCSTAAVADEAPGADSPEQLARVRALESARVALVERLAPTVVCIFPKANRNGGGSGVIIHPEGYGLTNYHVVASLGGRDGEGGRSDGKLYPLEVLGIDPAGDIAMFKLKGRTASAGQNLTAAIPPIANQRGLPPSPSGSGDGEDKPFPYTPLGDSSELRVGDWTLAMGNPFLLAEDYYPTVTCGIVSGLHRYLAGSGRALIYTDCIEIDTSINPGNSGGPLFNMHGEVVGINGRIGIEERGRVNVGVGYAISANQIKRFMPALRAGLICKHATLGATVYDKSFGVVMVDQILETSDAYRAGLRLSDRVLKFNGIELKNANQLKNLVESFPAAWPVELTIAPDQRRASDDDAGGETGAQPKANSPAVLRFRLDAMPLPREPKPPPNLPPDVLKRMPKPITEPSWDANYREVKRLLQQAQAALGGAEATKAVASWTMTVQRTTAKGDKPTATEVNESRDAIKPLDDSAAALAPTELESAVRWMLLDPPAKPKRSQWKINGVDEVSGRLVVVLERKLDADRRVEMSFDDATVQLLRLSFTDGQSGKPVRYEYADHRREGPLRLPHKRVLYLGDQAYATDVIRSYKLNSRESKPEAQHEQP